MRSTDVCHNDTESLHCAIRGELAYAVSAHRDMGGVWVGAMAWAVISVVKQRAVGRGPSEFRSTVCQIWLPTQFANSGFMMCFLCFLRFAGGALYLLETAV